MPPDNIITDDYVAELLAKDAHEHSIKYSALGMDAFQSSKPANKPKPNKRFLQNIIKQTTNHNAALLAKETAESQARLQDLRNAEEKEQRRQRRLEGRPKDVRQRQLGDIAAIIGGRPKRSKGEGEANGEDASSSRGRSSKTAALTERSRNTSSEGTQSPPVAKPKRRERRDYSDRGNGEETRRHHRERRRSHSDDERESRHRHRRRRERSQSPKPRERKHRERSPYDSSDSYGRTKSRHRRAHRAGKRRDGRLKEQKDLHGTEDDSDPLEEIIGPKPASPVRARGRGAFTGSSGIDSRFSAAYDPKTDVSVDEDMTDDWDDAQEKMRDREKWRQQGADRLRQAGFTEEDIKKWKRGGEKDIDDVRWSKKGEKREWDRGKQIASDGTVASGADWTK